MATTPAPAPPINLFAQLEALDAQYFTTALTTTHDSVKDAVAATLVASAPATIGAALASTAPLAARAASEAPAELQPVISAFAPLVIQSLTTNLFNWGLGHLFGSADEHAAESTENASGIGDNPLGSAV